MSIANSILCAMKMNVFYRPCDIVIVGKNISTSEKKKILDMLARGGLIESVVGDGYRRKKLYKTKQQSLF